MSAVMTMIVVVLVAGVVVGLSAVTSGGSRAVSSVPGARHLRRIAAHLNGEAEPPAVFVRFLD